MSSFMERRKGLLCTFAIAVVAVMLDKLFPVIGSAVFAIILGMALNQFWKSQVILDRVSIIQRKNYYITPLLRSDLQCRLLK